jgi:nicotinate-nucleotide pyrophosphorylase (carboxylating)
MTGLQDSEYGLSVDDIIRLALAEDVGPGDITTLATIPEDAVSAARIIAKEDCVLAGIDVAGRVFAQVDGRIHYQALLPDGTHVASGSDVARISGPARGMLTAERTAVNLLQRLSGIATITSRYVEQTAGTRTRILDTRKTPPLLRTLAKYAVRCGGGTNHRIGLYDAVLIKDNHIQAAGGIAPALRRVHELYGDRYTIEIEVETLDQLGEALAAGTDIVLLDNMPPKMIRRARELHGPDFRIEASGCIALSDVAEYAAAGADHISVGALTHSAPCIDFSLEFD